jgi:hypothetical protein
MKAVLSSMLIAIFVSVAGAEELASVAKVDFATLQPLLLEVAFARPQNKDLQTQYLASQKKFADMVKTFDRDGKHKMESMARAELAMNKLMASRRVRNLTRAELILIIEALYKDKYQVVISKTFNDPVLYTTGPIPDITDSITQHLLKQTVVENTTTTKD